MATEHVWNPAAGAGDWNAGATWSSGEVPGSVGGAGTSSAIFDGTNTVDATTNLDRSLDNILLQVVTHPSSRNNIGSLGNPLIHEVASAGTSTSRIRHLGTGQFFYSGASGGINDVFVGSSRGTGFAMVLDGEIRNLFIRSGQVNVLPTCNLGGAGGVVVLDGPNALVQIEAQDAAETIPTRIICYDGRVANYRDTQSGDVLIATRGTWLQVGELVTGAQVFHDQAFFAYEPAVLPSGNPGIYTARGAVDLSNQPFELTFDDVFLGRSANVHGSLVQGQGIGISGFDIDFRDPFP